MGGHRGLMRKNLIVMGLFVGLLGTTPVRSAPEETAPALVKRVVKENQFTVTRGLKDYQDFFGASFRKDLQSLRGSDHWLDGGAGNAYAQKDFLGSRDGKRILADRPKMTAVSLVYPADEPLSLAQGRFRMLAGRYFEEIPIGELEKADLITDVTGILNYTEQLDWVLERYLNLLQPNGKIYVFIPRHITRIRTARGAELSLVQWLKTISGLQITEIKDQRVPYPSDQSFIIERVASNVKVPKLKLLSARKQVAVFREFTEIE